MSHELNCTPIRDLLEEDTLSPSEQAHLEAHLSNCVSCRAEVDLRRLIRESMALLPMPEPSLTLESITEPECWPVLLREERHGNSERVTLRPLFPRQSRLHRDIPRLTPVRERTITITRIAKTGEIQ